MQIIILTFICSSFWALLHGRVSKLPNFNEEVFMENEEPKEIIYCNYSVSFVCGQIACYFWTHAIRLE